MSIPVGIARRNTTSSSVHAYNFFASASSTAAYVQFVFLNQVSGSADENVNFLSSELRITNDGGGDIQYSFDGVNVHGVLLTGESLQTNVRREYSIFIRIMPASVASAFRLEAW